MNRVVSLDTASVCVSLLQKHIKFCASLAEIYEDGAASNGYSAEENARLRQEAAKLRAEEHSCKRMVEELTSDGGLRS